MTTYSVIRFEAGGENHVLKDDFSSIELDSIKYYYIEILTYDVPLSFKFDTLILMNTIAELYENPTVSAQGRLLTGTNLSYMYADPTVTNEGNLFYDADPDSKFLEIHYITLSANTNYLLKITPKDLNSTIVS